MLLFLEQAWQLATKGVLVTFAVGYKSNNIDKGTLGYLNRIQPLCSTDVPWLYLVAPSLQNKQQLGKLLHQCCYVKNIHNLDSFYFISCATYCKCCIVQTCFVTYSYVHMYLNRDNSFLIWVL